jgi:hypothetical protein
VKEGEWVGGIKTERVLILVRRGGVLNVNATVGPRQRFSSYKFD